MLEQIFSMQKQLDEFIEKQHPDLMPTNMNDWVKQITIAIDDEISEIRGEINWKHWKEPKPIDLDKLQEEVIDVWHFLISLSYRVGLEPDDIFEVYKKKWQENFDRQNGKSAEKDYRAGGGGGN
ncbi:dUTPase [Weizmannia sp. CD-2023]|uniref:dUTPase n=1 Tax=Heyndrickxia TaxID=2837504 RepID=UPI002E1FB13A|nr:dUTPase [Weizmannia sp. CD-2023]MED4899783.1 dUTPase [Weizmannia sp. CD-2023]